MPHDVDFLPHFLEVLQMFHELLAINSLGSLLVLEELVFSD